MWNRSNDQSINAAMTTLPPGTRLGTQYVLVSLLGQGAYNKVYLASHIHTNHLAAIKTFPLATLNLEGRRRRAKLEIESHSRLNHPNIVKFIQAFYAEDVRCVCLVMEFADRGTLKRMIDSAPQHRLAEPAARWFFQQLLLGVDYCHRAGVVNRDIKLENVLLATTPGGLALKLSDFGFCKSEMASQPDSVVGSCAYMAPEIMETMEVQETYDGRAADVWSCGVVLHIMLAGAFPFAPLATNLPPPMMMLQMLQQIKSGVYTPPIHVSPACKDLLQSIFVRDPRARASVPTILSHPWFNTDIAPAVVHVHQQALGMAPSVVAAQGVDALLRGTGAGGVETPSKPLLGPGRTAAVGQE